MNPSRLLAALTISAAIATGADAQVTLRSAPIGDLRNIDPVWTTAYISRNHGFLVFDTLFGTDSEGRPRPQMVESYEASPDNLTWRFTLRPGLKWHDGAPVRAIDCVASLRRWGARDGMGRALMAASESLLAVDERTFVLKLKHPIGFVLDALAKVDSITPFMMPERLALTDPAQQIPEAIGSGQFIFRKDEWVPGSKVVYVKNPDYLPRGEPASNTAGGKHAHVDRVEWRYLPDYAVAIAALNAGEIDMIENPPLDLIKLMQASPDVTVELVDPVGSHAFARPNHLHPPFNNPKIRQAVIHAINQEQFLRAAYGDRQYWNVCHSYFTCGTPFETKAGAEPYEKPDVNMAKKLLAEAGYRNEKVVLLVSTDIPHLNTHAQVMARALRGMGLNLEMISTDWSSVVARRTSKSPPEQGGWNMMITANVATGLQSPISNTFIAAACEQSVFGWPCDAKVEELRQAFARATEAVEQKRIAEELHRRLYEVVPYYILGQYRGVTAYRKSLSGVLQSPARLYWNIRKSG